VHINVNRMGLTKISVSEAIQKLADEFDKRKINYSSKALTKEGLKNERLRQEVLELSENSDIKSQTSKKKQKDDDDFMDGSSDRNNDNKDDDNDDNGDDNGDDNDKDNDDDNGNIQDNDNKNNNNDVIKNKDFFTTEDEDDNLLPQSDKHVRPLHKSTNPLFDDQDDDQDDQLDHRNKNIEQKETITTKRKQLGSGNSKAANIHSSIEDTDTSLDPDTKLDNNNDSDNDDNNDVDNDADNDDGENKENSKLKKNKDYQVRLMMIFSLSSLLQKN